MLYPHDILTYIVINLFCFMVAMVLEDDFCSFYMLIDEKPAPTRAFIAVVADIFTLPWHSPAMKHKKNLANIF